MSNNEEILVNVTVMPGGLTFTGKPGQTLMSAANTAGVFWPTVCGGESRCLVCMVSVDDTANAALAPPAEQEVSTLTRVGRSPDKFRLGCAARLTDHDVTVIHRKVRPAKEGDRMPFA